MGGDKDVSLQIKAELVFKVYQAKPRGGLYGGSLTLLFHTLVTRSQATPAPSGTWGQPEHGFPGGPFPFPAVVRPRGKWPEPLLLQGPELPVLDMPPIFPHLLALPWRRCSWLVAF